MSVVLSASSITPPGLVAVAEGQVTGILESPPNLKIKTMQHHYFENQPLSLWGSINKMAKHLDFHQ
jgi:hypothetical protein